MAFGFDFGPRVLAMERGKIERETKREKKKDFCLGGTQEEGESKVLLPSRHKESVCESKEK